MKKWFRTGKPWIWLTAGAVSVSLIAVIGLVIMIGWRGLSFFWPSAIHEMDVLQADGSTKHIIGEVYDTETVPTTRLPHSTACSTHSRATATRMVASSSAWSFRSFHRATTCGIKRASP